MAQSQKKRRRAAQANRHRGQQVNRYGRLSDKLWSVYQRYLPPEPTRTRRGHPVVSFRRVLSGLLYRLRTGCQWKAIPSEFGSGSTCHTRFQEWQTLGVFEKGWADQVRAYDRQRGIGWTWQSLDSAIISAPLGGA